jgi:hypothetical protein
MSKGHAVLKFLRKIHLYLGIFTAPALLFFAFTGAMQTFSLHETTQGSSYKPPLWIATLAQIHKKQDWRVPLRKVRPPVENGAPGGGEQGSKGAKGSGEQAGKDQAAPAEKSGTASAPAPKNHLPMKFFFLLVAMSLATSTLTGIYMSYKYNRGWLLLTGLLMAGLAIPLLLLPF